MKQLTPAERREALKSFVETPGSDLQIIDRSTAERWANCPWQAKAVEDGRCKTVGIMAEAGNVIHDAFSQVTTTWIESNGALTLADLRQDAEFAIRNARPDLQPEAIKASHAALWSWARMIYSVHPGNILAFDGGDDLGRGGQLAIDYPDLGTRVTSEIDLLYSTDAPEVVEEVDYKTGWKVHEISDVADSFQFQLHALLIFENYPGINAVSMRVFDTRSNNLTFRVTFKRDRMHDYSVRVRAAIESRVRHWADPPTWPVLEKCGICHAAALCPVADQPIADLSKDPAGFVKALVAVEARADAMRKLAADWVDANGQDIQSDSVWFGRRKPKANRKAEATIYSLESK